MKKILILIVAICYAVAYAQTEQPKALEVKTTNSLGQEVITCTPVKFFKTPPVRDWPEVQDLTDEEQNEVPRMFDMEGYLEAAQVKETDPIVQDVMGTRTMRAPIVNFDGLSSASYPPDPSGAAGPNHYVQAINTRFRVYDKSGNPETPIRGLSSLWSGSSNEGDPIVMYDRHADRWFISQFQVNPNRILVAISETSDPTGAYYAYEFTLSQFPDYPKYSIWWDGYYMTSNSNHTAVVFERDAMLAGDANAQMVSLSLPDLNFMGFKSPLPADADGPLPPDGTPCYFFNLEDNAFQGVDQDRIKIYEMTTDWTNTANSQAVISQTLPVDPFDAVFTGEFSNIAQPGTGQRLDAIMGVFMYRAQHMRWIGYNTIMLSHAVDMGGNRSAVRWYELRDQNDGNWSVHQSGTYDPDGTSSRWMSSCAMDAYGNIGLAYSICNSTDIYPGIRYTGRLGTDPLGQMTFAEEIAVDGLGSQTITDRFGDYGHMSLDPDGGTFWHTGEWISTNGATRNRIFSFQLLTNVGIGNPYYEQLSLIVSQADGMINVDAAGIYGEEEVQIDLMGMDGRIIATTKLYPAGGKASQTFESSSLGAGIYFVRIGNKNFQSSERVLIGR